MTPNERLAPMLQWSKELQQMSRMSTIDWLNCSHALIYANADAHNAADAEFRAQMFLHQGMPNYAWAFAIAYVLLKDEVQQ